MKKKILSRHENIRTKAALSLIFIVAFVMLVNAANFPFIISEKITVSKLISPIEVKSEIERIYGVVDMPVKIVNAMLNKSGLRYKAFCGVQKESIMAQALYSTIRREDKGESPFYEKDIAFMGNSNKKQLPFLQEADFSGNYFSLSANSLLKIPDREFKLLLLLLILTLSYPRGTPIKNTETKIKELVCK